MRRLLGQGGMGAVYLARDTTLGRSVALKLVRRTDTHGFLNEARLIARLNHPNIVQLYDFGEHHGAVYLALEYIDGETLHNRMRTAFQVGDALRLLYAIADAIAHAHAAGVWHCDLKPSNVMLGRDGRVRVVDFGVALTREGDGTRGGTVAWMAPEQQGAAPITERVDVWALGLVAAQLFTPDAARALVARDGTGLGPETPVAVAQLIGRSLASAPYLRPTAGEWRRTIERALDNRSDGLDDDGPFPGLSAFDEQRARHYVGREREIDEFVERLRTEPLVPITGASGAGKSSFLFAGIIPRLHSREPWTVVSLRPGADPIGALARRLAAASPDDAADSPDAASARLADLLRETPTLLAARLETIARATGTRVLVAVDQLEEVFTQCASATERDAFLAMLVRAADGAEDPVRVVATVRDDFIGRIHGLRSLFVVQPLGPEELRRAIKVPLDRCGYAVDDEILEELVDELGRADTAGLPLLQFACRVLWDGRDVESRRLRRSTYDEIGRLGGALARHADRALAELPVEQRAFARPILLQLVSRNVRRSLTRAELLAAIGDTAEPALDRLLLARLLVQRVQSDSHGDHLLVEIAHESLLSAWTQLARWIEDSREERRLLDDLEDAVDVWDRRGKRAEDTWSSADLAGTRHHVQQLGLVLPPRTEAFLATGEDRHRIARRRRRTRWILAASLVLLLAIPIAVAVGRYQAREELIRSNAGTIELHLQMFDIVDGLPVHVGLDRVQDLTWQLFAAKPSDPNEPGEPIPSSTVSLLDTSAAGTARVDRVRAPGGTVFLRFTHRGTGGDCAPSWVRIQSFPGYSTQASPRRVAIEIPSCQASRAAMVEVPAGEFIYGGAGEPGSVHAEYIEDERTASLRAFAIDRTEVSNAMFAPFARLADVTGYAAPVFSKEPKHAHDGDPAYPVTEIDAFQARAFCRYMGKRLPGDLEWVKAARGGLVIDGVPNRSPRRLYPWGTANASCANQAGEADGYAWVAPVDSFPCGASPYGVLNMAGNVQEWIDRAGQVDAMKESLHAMRGGAADSPPELEHITTIYRNFRNPRRFEYSIGLRCVAGGLDHDRAGAEREIPHRHVHRDAPGEDERDHR